MKTDTLLRDDIMAELDWDPRFDARDIGVAVKNGIVTLTGHVESYAERIAAQEAAQTVSGVKAIANDLEVKLLGDARRNDSEIAAAAVAALKYNVSVPDSVTLVVRDGWVILNGEVNMWYQKSAAENSIRYLFGVKGVTNSINIKPAASATDVKRKIESAFQRHAHLEAEGISISVAGSTVTLEGKVNTWQERREAEEAAWAAPGISRVNDNLQVRL